MRMLRSAGAGLSKSCAARCVCGCVLTPVSTVLPGNFTVGSTRRLGATSSFWPYY